MRGSPRILAIVLSFALLASALAGASLDTLVKASATFSGAILQQLGTVQGTPLAAELAEKTIAYAAAKTAYYEALRAAAPELTDIATGKGTVEQLERFPRQS